MDIASLIKSHEGLRLALYIDTRGHPTIGWGRVLDVHGISAAEAELLLANDIAAAHEDLVQIFGALNGTDARIAALLDMRFNLGPAGFRQFKKLIAAVRSNDWATAASEALTSTWSTQVGDRAKYDAELLRTGEWRLS